MSAYGRASTILGLKETLAKGVAAIGGVRGGTSKKGGDGVRITGKGWVGAGEAGPKVRAEGAGPEGRDAEFSGSEVGEGGGDDVVAGLAVNVAW